MFPEHVILSIAAFAGGVAVAAGTFAFLLVIGVIPRILWRFDDDRKETAGISLKAEMWITGGVILGAVLSLWTDAPGHQIADIPGKVLTTVWGLCSGIFVGSIAVSLAEIIDTFPILFRRFGLEEPLPDKLPRRSAPKLEWLMLAMALGKLSGALLQFVFLSEK